MNFRHISVVIMALALAGCKSGGNTRSAPSLTPTQAAAQPPRKNLLEEVGDTTVRIVQEPVRMVTPKKADPKHPEVYEAPEVTIVRRGTWTDPVTTQPAKP